VAMEAHSAGLPVVATCVGGTPDVVDNTATGYLHQVGDVAGLAEACIAILRDRNLRESMGTAARKRMSQDFSAEVMINRYLELVSASNAPARNAVEDSRFTAERIFKARHP
jgi:glycosyltransferase involved in cell wall biosynthesis